MDVDDDMNTLKRRPYNVFLTSCASWTRILILLFTDFEFTSLIFLKNLNTMDNVSLSCHFFVYLTVAVLLKGFYVALNKFHKC